VDMSEVASQNNALILNNAQLSFQPQAGLENVMTLQFQNTTLSSNIRICWHLTHRIWQWRYIMPAGPANLSLSQWTYWLMGN